MLQVSNRRGTARKLAIAASFVASVSIPSLALAQTSVVDPPFRSVVDEHGVDLSTGKMSMKIADVSIGDPAAGGLGHSRNWVGSQGWRDQYNAVLNVTTSTGQVSIGDQTTIFSRSGSTFTNQQGDGATLAISGANYIFTMADGTTVKFVPYSGTNFAGTGGGTPSAIATEITQPSGAKLALTYYHETIDARVYGGGLYTYSRLDNVASNAGFQLRYAYSADYIDLFDNNTALAWMNEAGVTAVNNAVDCVTCALTQSWPTATYGGTTSFMSSLTDAAGLVTNFVYGGQGIAGIKRPGDSTTDVAISIYSSGAHIGKIYQVVKGGNTTTYSWSLSGSTMTATITDTLSRNRTITADTTQRVMKSHTDAASQTTSYGHDSYGRVTSITLPGTQVISYAYDSRGNQTSVTRNAASGSGIASITTSAFFPSSCSNPKTCNKPETTTDERGKVTNYYYDSTHGGLTQVVYPADTTGTRPQTNYAYGSYSAWYKVSFGILTAASAVYKPYRIWSCQTAASCTYNASDSALTTIDYEAGSSSMKSNLLPVTVSQGSGSSPAMRQVSSGYDTIGNVTSVDGPLSGTADTVRMRYDADRRLIGVVSADPDSSTGPMKPRAVKYSYNGATGLLDKVETGTVTNPTDDPAGLSVLDTVTYTYDNLGRKLTVAHGPSGSPLSVAAYAYDVAGRLDCAAVRLNLSSLPSDACTPGTAGSDGPDRITKNNYNALDQITSVQTGYAVSAQTVIAYAYTSNGRVASVTDGNSNLTGYHYDAHDRLNVTCFGPSAAASPGCAAAGDYENYIMDDAGNVTQRRLRDGTTIGYTYDNLGRLTFKDLPGAELDITYVYDLLGRQTSAATSAQTLTYGYDALSQLASAVSPRGTITHEYDAAGQRTKLTWPDSYYVNYDYLVTGEMEKVRENGATTGIGVLARYGYDDRGRRKSRTLGNGNISNYDYDSASRLTSLGIDAAGTAYDTTITLTYNAAGQIKTRTGTNDAFAWAGAANLNRSYSPNSLNQYTASGSVSLGYDGRGNLSTSGSDSYSYSSENLMTSATVGGITTTITYDPALRLGQEVASGVTLQYLYDGDEAIGRYNSGTLQRHMIFGAGTDELVAQQIPASGARAFFQADERGSVIAYSDSSGSLAYGPTAYDEYGIHSGFSPTPFGYTGQRFLGTTGLYYYKARMYSATLGRFMQTDPIGYADGPNWYNYVGGDPINRVDPSGLDGGEINVQGYPYNYGNGIGGGTGPGTSAASNSASSTMVLTSPAPEIRVSGSRASPRERSDVPITGGSSSGMGIDATPVNEYDGEGSEEIVVSGQISKETYKKPPSPGPNGGACEIAFKACETNATKVYDAGDVNGSHLYYRACRFSYGNCVKVQNDRNSNPLHEFDFALVRFPKTGTVYFWPFSTPYFTPDPSRK